MTKPAVLRALEDEDLRTRLREAEKELFNLRFQLATGRLDNVGRISTVKREIARLLTLMDERGAATHVTPSRGLARLGVPPKDLEEQ
jgi:large subunit ribosomal protein L29